MKDHQILAWLISLVGFGVPLGKIFHRAGFSACWGLLGLFSFLAMLIAWIVPLVNVIFLWVFAFAKWPNEPKNSVDVID